MELFLAGYGFKKSIYFTFDNRYGRLVYYDNSTRILAEIYIWRKLMEIYFVSDWSPLVENREKKDKFINTLNRLFSYEANKQNLKKLNDLWDEIDKMFELYRAGLDKFGKEKAMELFLAGGTEREIDTNTRQNLLFSYLLQQNKIEQFKELGNLFIDSGAFTAWTKGKEVNVDEYIKFINDRSDFIYLYGQVDSIPGDRVHGATYEQVVESAKKTWENYLYMRPKMNNPKGLLYTFHVGEPLNFLETAMEWTDENGEHIPYIALGGMVGKPKEIRKQFLDSCFDVIKKSSNPNVKVHAFGMTDFELLEQYPITSADSTSWIMTGATGSIMTKFGNVVVSEQQSNDPNYYEHLPKKLLKDLKNEVEKYGFTLDELKKDRDARIMLNAKYMLDRAKNLTYKPTLNKKRLF